MSDLTPMPAEAMDWYARKYVRMEIVKCLQHREMAFLDCASEFCVRDLNGWNIDYFDQTMDAYGAYRKSYRIYKSVGLLDKTPILSFKASARKTDKIEAKRIWGECTRYDFVIDLDSKTVDKAKKQALGITQLYKDLGLPYSVTFSGNKGFHIVVEDRHSPPMEKKNEACARMAKYVYDNVKAPDIDASIYDVRRIIKVPYSVDFKSGEPLVVLPLTDEQLNSFKVEDAKINNVFKTVKIFQRGVLERPGEDDAMEDFIDLTKDIKL